MKKSLLGLGLGVALMLLMLLAMVSSSAEEPATVAPQPPPAYPCAVVPMEVPGPQQQGTAPEKQPETRHTAILAPSFAAPAGPSADANGVPLLMTTYRRSNYRAFHFADEAG